MLAIPDNILTIATLLLTCYIVWDFALSFKAALDLRDVLVSMEKLKGEMQRIQKRAEVIAAVAGEDWAERREAMAENAERRKVAFAETVDQRKQAFAESMGQKKRHLPKVWQASKRALLPSRKACVRNPSSIPRTTERKLWICRRSTGLMPPSMKACATTRY